MSVAELTANIQFTVDQQGHVTAVIVKPLLWQHIVDALADTDLIHALQAHGLTDPEVMGVNIGEMGESKLAQNGGQVDLLDSAFATMLASEHVLRKEGDALDDSRCNDPTT